MEIPPSTERLPRAKEPEFRGLDPQVRVIWIIEALTTSLFLSVFLGIAPTIMTFTKKWPLVFPGWLIPIALFFLMLIPSLLVIQKRFQRWKFRVSGDEVTVDQGVYVHRRTTIPRGRIQHVDVTSGVWQRMWNLASISIHTAGAMAVVQIPGLKSYDAEALRSELIGTKP